MTPRAKILQVCAIDVTARFLLRPLICRLKDEGFQTEIACSPGQHAEALKAEGIVVREIPISRALLSLNHLRSVWQLFRLMRREHYDIVHVHTPIAAILGRMAARFAQIPIVIYTAHGFYFHDNMPAWKRWPLMAIERVFGQGFTDFLFTQSHEDYETALRERIIDEERASWIGNGIDPQRFASSIAPERKDWGLSESDFVIGFVGRFVQEKGIVELLDAVAQLHASYPPVRLLLVGGHVSGDRDQTADDRLLSLLKERNLHSLTVVTGFQDDAAPFYKMMDVFVLPSHREGMPRTILEAMASGLPVVASDIRGCREEVVDGQTGLLFPMEDADALAQAIRRLIDEPQLRVAMGAAGQAVANEQYDERLVLDRQMRAFDTLLQDDSGMCDDVCGFGGRLKRIVDLAVACLGLILLAIPFLVISLAIKLDDGGPIFFRQERVGKAGHVFRVWKFRTMVIDATKKGLGHTVAIDDDRITRVGRILRNLGLDELPQLVNVVLGEMSLVGPRPTLEYQVERYDRFQRRRLEAKPGITSLAVVSGRNALSWEQRIRLDVWYIDHWTMLLDISILFRTLWKVLITREGLYGEGGVNDTFVDPPTRTDDEGKTR